MQKADFHVNDCSYNTVTSDQRSICDDEHPTLEVPKLMWLPFQQSPSMYNHSIDRGGSGSLMNHSLQYPRSQNTLKKNLPNKQSSLKKVWEHYIQL